MTCDILGATGAEKTLPGHKTWERFSAASAVVSASAFSFDIINNFGGVRIILEQVFEKVNSRAEKKPDSFESDFF